MIALRSDIDGLSAQEFLNVIDEIGRKAKTGTTRAKKQQGPADDKPTTRIAHLLRVKLGLSDQQAVSSLYEALLNAGVRTDALPTSSSNLDAWLDRLLVTVADSKVMAIAKRLEPVSG